MAPTPAETAALEDAFGEAVADAIAADAAGHPADGPLVRIVLRWFEINQPSYFTLHLLGSNELESATGDESWLPLEWDNADREFERTERVTQSEAVERAAAPLAPVYEAQVERELAAEDAGEVVPEQPGGGVSRAILETVRRLPAALQRHGVAATADFAATATHFEAYGGLDVLRMFTAPEIVAAYEARDELPWE